MSLSLPTRLFAIISSRKNRNCIKVSALKPLQ